MRSILALLYPSELRFLAALSANFAVVWLIGVLTSRDQLTLLGNLVGAIVALYIGLTAERLNDY